MKAKLFVSAASILLASAQIVEAANPELVSRTTITPPATTTASGNSLGSQYSPDGSLILFSSDAFDLIDGVGNGFYQIYARGRAAGTLSVVSVSTSGAIGIGSSYLGGVSADNRFVTFQSGANNLVANDKNNASDVFLRDLVDGTTTLVSHSTNAAPASATGNGASEYPQISRDGKWVVFESTASDLTAGDGNIFRDLYAWNRLDGSIHLVSAGPQGDSLKTDSSNFSITADGRYVLFEGFGTNLVEVARPNGEIYLRDLQTETTRWISAAATNLPNMSLASFNSAVISEDARYVFFVGTPPATTAGKPALIRVDLNDNSAIIITNSFPTVATPSYSTGPTISNDGQFVAWATGANVFRWNAATAQIERVDATADGTLGDAPQLSSDGRYIAFVSNSTNLVDTATNGTVQIFVRDTLTGTTRLVSQSASGGAIDDLDFPYVDFTPDGSKLLFETSSTEIAPDDSNNSFDVFEWDMATGVTTLLTSKSVNAQQSTALGASSMSRNSISADGRFVVFQSVAHLTSNDTNNAMDIYLRDRGNGTTTLMSATTDGFSPSRPSSNGMITSDGQWVLFETTATNLAGAGDTRTAASVYARNVATGEMFNISGPQTGTATLFDASGNGRFVFLSNGTQLNRHDLKDHSNIVISTSGAFSSISADGARVLFGKTVKILPNGPAITVPTQSDTLSPDGTIVYIRSTTNLIASNLVTGVTRTAPANSPVFLKPDASGQIVAYSTLGSAGNAFFVDLRSGANVAVSRNFASTNFGNNVSGGAAISPNGRFIAYESFASDLVSNDNNGFKDVFLYDRYTDRTTLLSHKPNSDLPGNSFSANPFFSADGSTIVFVSIASDFVAGDYNDMADVYVISVPNPELTNEDTDNDGLPDWWERANFSTLSFNGDDDPDQDGFSNRAEFHAGTNPTDAASALKIVAIGLEPNGDRSIVWSAVAGKSYRVEFTGSIEAPAWTTVLNNVGATTDTVKAIDATANAGGYYRIVVAE